MSIITRWIPTLCSACAGSGKGYEEPGRTTTGGTPCILCGGSGKVLVMEITTEGPGTPIRTNRCPNEGSMCNCTGACMGMSPGGFQSRVAL